VEVFDAANPGKDHFDTGPVGGFAVRDLPAAVDELRAAGVELLGEAGPSWQHFRGPDARFVQNERQTQDLLIEVGQFLGVAGSRTQPSQPHDLHVRSPFRTADRSGHRRAPT
jgi:hypothetical protein